jgi:hypothetical protein
MGYVQATIALSHPLMLCIPEHVVFQLQLEQESLREVTVADGRVMQVPSCEGSGCWIGSTADAARLKSESFWFSQSMGGRW